MLAENTPDAELYHGCVVCRDTVTFADDLCAFSAHLEREINREIAAGNVLLFAEQLKGKYKRTRTDFRILLFTLMSIREHVRKLLGCFFDISRMNLATILHVRKVGAGLPTQRIEPVLFGTRHVIAVCIAILLVHELVESLFHRVFAIGKCVAIVKASHERLAELLVICTPNNGVGERNFRDFIKLHLI